MLKSVVSSALRINVNKLLAFGMSFIYIRNSNGPNIDPWGTPVKIVWSDELSLFTSTY